MAMRMPLNRSFVALLLIASSLNPLVAAWKLSSGALDYYLDHAAADYADVDLDVMRDVVAEEGSQDIESVLGIESAKRGRGSRAGRSHRGTWRSVLDEGAARGNAESSRGGRRDSASRRKERSDSVQIEVACEGLRVACDLTTNCNAVTCTKETKDGSQFSLKHAPSFLQSAVDMWSSKEGHKCRIRETASRSISCASRLFAERVQ